MGAFKDKLKGFMNMGSGRLKRGMAHDTNDPGLNLKGTAQETGGAAQKNLGDLKSKAGQAAENLGSKIKRTG